MSSRSSRTVVVTAMAGLVLVGLGSVACSSSDDASPTTTGSTPASSTSLATTAVAADQTSPAGLNGITVDGDTLWVASIVEDSVIGIDPSTGRITARVPTAGAGPDDVAMGADGEIWVTGFVSGDLGVIRDGRYSVVTPVGSALNPVDVAEDGTVYVGRMVAGSDLYRLDPGGSSVAPVASGLDLVNAFAVDSDGTLLAPLAGSRIVRVDPTDGVVTDVVGGLEGVLATARSEDGRYVALGNLSGKVFDVDVDAGTATPAIQLSHPGPFDNLAFAEDGTLYVTVLGEPTIVEVAPDGTQRQIRVGT